MTNAKIKHPKSKPDVAAKSATKNVAASGTIRGGAKGGLSVPVMPSAELAAIIGKDALPRSEVVSRLWAYIKQHKLQNNQDKRQIDADANLVAVFGKSSVSMFEMNKLLNRHLSALPLLNNG